MRATSTRGRKTSWHSKPDAASPATEGSRDDQPLRLRHRPQPEPRRARILLAEKAELAEIAGWHWRTEFGGLMAVAEAMRKRSPAMAVDFARAVKVKPGEPHHHLQRWRAAMALRPSMSL